MRIGLSSTGLKMISFLAYSNSLVVVDFVKRFINKLGTQGITKKTLCRGRIICEGLHPFETRMRFTFVQAQIKKKENTE